MNMLLRWIIQLSLFALLLLCAWKTWEQAHAYERETLLIIQQLETETRVENAGRHLLELITLGLYDGYTEKLDELGQHRQLRQAYADSVKITGAAFFIVAAGFLLVVWYLNRTTLDVGYAMLLVALVALAVGLSTPILSVEASKELPVLGETVFQFKSKGILSTIDALRQSGNLWLALLLFVFSVIVPLLKTLLVGMTWLNHEHHLFKKGLNLSHHMGKWSMADVFVVAILVAYFANSGQDLTEAEVQAGLLFFAAYVILSLIGTQLISRGISRQGG
ncbi:MAG: paraquat-inducible protein A [Pseudomonadota bacterium]